MKMLIFSRKQKGVTLLVALLVLTIATLIALYAMKSTTFQLKMSSNERILSKTFWCTKSLLDHKYETYWPRVREKAAESVFGKAYSESGKLVDDNTSYLQWEDTGAPGVVDAFDPTQSFSLVYAERVKKLPEGYGVSDNEAHGFELRSTCEIGVSSSTQLLGVTGVGMKLEGSCFNC